MICRILPLLACAALAAGADAVPDYAKDIAPLLDKRCVECHGAKKAKGKLRLDTPEAIQKGGKNGAVVVAGKPEKSPLYGRTILPPGDDDIMPAKGDPLTKAQTELLRAWIAGGAPFGAGKPGAAKPDAAKPDAKPGDAKPAAPAKDKGAKDDKDAKDKKPDGSSSREPTGPTDIDRLAGDLGKPDAGAVASLTKRGARVQAISANGALLDVDCSHVGTLADGDAAALKTLGAHVAWLDLGHTDATPTQLACIEAMPNLVRLHLEYTKASDATLRHCEKCPHLAYVNVVGTEVGDDGLSRLVGLKELDAVYVAETKVTPAGITTLKTAAPDADVEGDMPADIVATSDQPATGKKRRKKKQ